MLFNVYKDLALAHEKNGSFQKALGAYSTAVRYTQNNNTKMELYFSMATIADKELKNYHMAVILYKEYRVCLFNYQNSLKDEKEIEEIESKLESLDEYIKLLTEEAMKKN